MFFIWEIHCDENKYYEIGAVLENLKWKKKDIYFTLLISQNDVTILVSFCLFLLFSIICQRCAWIELKYWMKRNSATTLTLFCNSIFFTLIKLELVFISLRKVNAMSDPSRAEFYFCSLVKLWKSSEIFFSWWASWWLDLKFSLPYDRNENFCFYI